MKKTSTRLASIGGLIVLGACAIALAQHDSRNRERDTLTADRFSHQPAEPIAVEGDWSRPVVDSHQADISSFSDDLDSMGTDSIVRANNDALPSYDDVNANPLRDDFPSAPQSTLAAGVELPAASTAEDTMESLPTNAADFANYEDAGEQSVALVSGEAPSDPPAWLTGQTTPPPVGQSRAPGPSTSQAATPSLPSLGAPMPSTSRSLNEYASGSSALPQLPTTSTPPPFGSQAGSGNPSIGNPSTARTSNAPSAPTMQPLPTFPAAAPGLPNVGSLSDGNVADPTGTTPPALPTMSTPRTGAQPFVQAPSNSLSDTQRGAMQPTELAPNQSATANSFGNSYPTPNLPTSTPPAYGALPTTPAAPGTISASDPNTRNPYASAGNANAASNAYAGGMNQTSAQPKTRSNTIGDTNTAYTAPTGANSSASLPASPASSSSRVNPSLASLVSNQPGNRYLDGSQNPIMVIQKRAPEEIQVGKNATFVITVRNSGNATAHDVTVVDSVPRGARFVEAMPAVRPTGDGLLTWKLGEIAAGDERTITLQIVPEVQGEVGSVATVHFAAQASVRTVATMPKLEVLLESQSEVLIGDAQQINVTVRNSGTGSARGVRLEADIPDQLRHDSGDSQLEAVLGDIRPNETKRIVLSAAAIAAGQSMCVVRAVSDDGIQAQQQVAVDVRAPQLIASILGPKLRYLERQATYQIAVKNTGTAAATNLDFVCHLPTGLKFNSANNRGSYDPANHTVTWGLYELPPGQAAPMEITVLPVELGSQVLTFSAKGDLGIAADAKGQVTVDGLAELAFTIGQDNGTIEVGTTSTYSVQITNVGNKHDSDVQLMVELPSGTELVAVDAPVEYRSDGRMISFAPVPEMRNKDQYTYRFQVRHNQAGSQIVRTKLTSKNWPNPVVKEEGTLVYNDQN